MHHGPGQAPDAMPLRGAGEPLATLYDVALLDLDRVVYLGGSPIPGAADALAKAAASGMRLAFVTNNASRTPSAIAAQLTGLGVPLQRSGSGLPSTHWPPWQVTAITAQLQTFAPSQHPALLAISAAE